MKVAIGSDHHGLEHRTRIKQVIEKLGGVALDMGAHSAEPCDYPDVAFEVAKAVRDASVDFGILVCGTGIGMSIAANKVSGIRAAVCHDMNTASLSRQHNNANVLCLPGKTLEASELQTLVECWLKTDFEGGRHARRVKKIATYESNHAQ